MSAKIEDTLKYSKKFPALPYNKLGRTGLNISPVGFGTYRVHISIDEHQQALEHSLQNGINVIDTSSNYADGGSEELVGAVLKRLIKNGKIKREEVVLISKVGYLQGQNYLLSQQLNQQNQPFKELVQYANGLEHCIHPDFIADQLTRSLTRLQTDCIDIYLLHNPEYYLMHAQKQGQDLKTSQKEYYRRIEQAFLHLEIEVQNGRIQYYGISSNTFPVNKNRFDFTSLEKIYSIAESFSADHHFRVIQFPFNLVEHDAITEKNQSGNDSLLSFAKKQNLAVLINRPLNAFAGRIIRLVSLLSEKRIAANDLEDALKKLAALEHIFAQDIIKQLKVSEKQIQELSGFFSSGIYLKVNYKKLGPYWTWIDTQSRFLAEQISYAVQQVNELPEKNPDVLRWLDDYVSAFNKVLDYLTLYYGQSTADLNHTLFSDLKKNIQLLDGTDSLQHAAIRSIRSTEGVSSVLVGMRRVDYVNNFLKELKAPLHDKFSSDEWQKVSEVIEKIKPHKD